MTAGQRPASPAAGRALLHDERGSLVLALLVAILAMSLGALALASARMAERSVRRDMSYATVVQVADAGVQHALSRVNQNQPLSDQSTPVPVGDASFTYTVTPLAGTAAAGYEVRSTGLASDGERRVVVARLEQETRLPYALFTNLSIGFNGANLVDSYSSEAVCVVLPACAWASPYSGAGLVASNNSVAYPGNATSDGTVLFNWEADPVPGRCSKQTSPVQNRTCAQLGLPVQTKDERLDLTTPEELAFITSMEATCDLRHPTGWPDWRATTDTAVSTPRVLRPPANLDHDFRCVNNLTFDADTILAPLGPSLNIRPVVMVVRGNIVLDRGAGNGPTVNCLGTCQQQTSVQFPRHLQIYSARPINITLAPQTKVAAVIYAPRASCQPGNPPAANVEFFGAVVCDNIGQVGGWELHYDRALAGIGTGRFVVTQWREELP